MTSESSQSKQESTSEEQNQAHQETSSASSENTSNPSSESSDECSDESGSKEPELSAEEQAELERQALEEELKSLSVEDFRAIKGLAAESQERWDRVLRLSAEFDNFKKRVARERQEAIRYANESLLERLIPVMDTFEMAMTAVRSADAGSIDSLKMGIEMISNQLKTVLSEEGLEEINAADQVFDPAIHEAVSKEAREDVEEGRILSQTRKGYKLKDRLIRPSSVVVSVAPESPSETTDDEASE